MKYYSAKNKTTYTCRDFLVFEQNGTYGKVSDPAVPPFEESGKYPETMSAVVYLPETLPFERCDKDILAAFVGDECRGVGEQADIAGKVVYRFESRGRKDETASVSCITACRPAEFIKPRNRSRLRMEEYRERWMPRSRSRCNRLPNNRRCVQTPLSRSFRVFRLIRA